MGIPDTYKDRIFDPFFTTGEQGEGTGLGLSTALTIVKSHGGSIHVYSEVDSGTAFEVEFLEIRHIGFAGMNIKTDNDGEADMEDVSLHDNYIHDILSEGFYIGSTQGQPQHQIRRFDIYNNRVLRVGTEAFQIGHVGDDTTVRNNVFGPSAMEWRSAFQNFQDGNLQMSIRGGRLDVYDNIFIGGAGKWAEFFGINVEGDAREEGDGIYLEDNYFSHVRNFGV